MIGSLMSRMGDAQKLSVPQLQKAIQSGVLPAYIGIPIIQDKLQQAKGAAQPVAPKSPIAQEILQQANQPQMGVEGLPSNLPTESMAGGGIVAFADGGLSDDEDEYEQAIEDEEFDRYQSLLANAGEYPKAEDTSAPPAKSTENKGVGINPNATGGIGIKDLLAAKAAQHKLPPQLLHSIAGLESGGKETAANPRSSAKGLFQFTDATWKGMGGKEGEQFDPEKNAELGALFTRQNAEGLKKSLGRNPTYGEVYAAHHFGLKGAKDLMTADPKTPIEMAVSPSVIKANPYLKDKNVGQVLAELNKKTGSGVVTLAEGGIAGLDQTNPSNDGIQSAAPYYGYAAGGSVKHYDGTESSLVNVDPMGGYSGNYEAKDTTFDPFQESLAKYKKDLEEKIKTKKSLEGTSLEAPTTKTTTPAKDLGPGLTADEMIAGSTRAGTLAAMDKDTTSGMDLVKPAGIDQAVAKKETGGLDDLIERLNKREAGYGKQKSIDNYMALLSAGLGMMGGTSPHAMANIGQGALMGVQNLSESNKLRAAEQANLDKTMATAIRYKEAQKAAEQGKKGQMALEYAKLGETQKTHIANIMGNREKMAQAQAAAYLKANPIAGLNADDPTAVADMANKLLARDPAYLKAYETYNGFGFTLPSGGGGGGNTMRFDAKGNEIK
jgi:hypothetical protein